MTATATAKFPRSTKPAPHLFLLAAGTGQHRPFPAPCCTSPHPLQNRVPRVRVLLPLPKTALLLLQWRCFLSLDGTSWQRGTAAPRAVRVVGRVRAGGTQATSRPRRQARQVLLPLPKTGGNTAFLPVFFFHVLYGRSVHTGSDIRFLHPFAPACNRSHPLQHPKRTRFRLFLAESGAIFSFSLLSGRKIFALVFVHPAA